MKNIILRICIACLMVSFYQSCASTDSLSDEESQSNSQDSTEPQQSEQSNQVADTLDEIENPSKRPPWIDVVPDDTDTIMYFVGVSEPSTDERSGRDSASKDALNQVSTYLEASASLKSLKKGTIARISDAGYSINGKSLTGDIEKLFSEKIVNSFRIKANYFEKGAKGEPFTYYVLTTVQKNVIEIGYQQSAVEILNDKAQQTSDENAKKELSSISNDLFKEIEQSPFYTKIDKAQ